MKVSETELPGVLLVEQNMFGDERGFFLETWRADRYARAGMPGPFVQDSVSFSRHGVLRGLHFQNPRAQGKLVYVAQGELFDVAVDIRVGSPTFGRWIGVRLSSENGQQLYVPPGFAHGFCVTGDVALVAYKLTEIYTPEAEGVILWNDPDIGIEWPLDAPELSTKDRHAARLRDVDPGKLPRFAGDEA